MTDEKTIKVGLGLYILNDRGQVLLGLRKAKHGEGPGVRREDIWNTAKVLKKARFAKPLKKPASALIPRTSAWRALPTTFSRNRESTM